MKTIISRICIIYTILLQPVCSDDELISIRVTKISDGDTVRAIVSGEEKRIRLWGIDAPEKNQSFGKKSKKNLGNLLENSDIQLKIIGIDRYKRTLGILYSKDKNINLQMVKDGYAWAYRKYNKESEYLEAQNTAKEKKLGLWEELEPTPPWEFRKKK